MVKGLKSINTSSEKSKRNLLGHICTRTPFGNHNHPKDHFLIHLRTATVSGLSCSTWPSLNKITNNKQTAVWLRYLVCKSYDTPYRENSRCTWIFVNKKVVHLCLLFHLSNVMNDYLHHPVIFYNCPGNYGASVFWLLTWQGNYIYPNSVNITLESRLAGVLVVRALVLTHGEVLQNLWWTLAWSHFLRKPSLVKCSHSTKNSWNKIEVFMCSINTRVLEQHDSKNL